MVERRHSPDSFMKTYCKHTRVADPRFVRESIDHYLRGKRSRRDVGAWLDHHPDLDRVAEAIASEIRTGRFCDTTIRYFNRTEPISGKHRVIGRESVHHQILDHVAIDAMRPMLDAKIGRWQTASVEGRGTIDARKAIKRWTRQRSSRWFVKLDVRKCYPSIDRTILKRLLARDVGDGTLLRLAYHLIDRYAGTQGLNIGSYASQWLANYYLSYAYHFATERLAKLRRRRDGTVVRHRLVTHVLFYMDDVLLIGRGKADLRMAARMLSAYLRRFLNLDVHPEWNAKRLALEPIDMVGFTFRPHGRVNIRHGVFLRARRNFRRARRMESIPVWLARRLASYYGYFKWSDSITYRRRNGIDKTMRRARKVLAA